MKLGKLSITAGAVLALGLCFQPNVGWSSIALGPMITGEVTAAPTSGTIEISHRAYKVKPNSAADKALRSVYVGETVDAVFDGPSSNSSAEIVSIVQHTGA
jgi:hypothetical protein